MVRNPPWSYDELILAMDLYVREGLLDDTDARVVELSNLLNALPIHTIRPDADRFRNPNGVAMKLANFAALDPDYPGAGLDAGGRRDAEVWDRFHGDFSTLRRLAARIRRGAIADLDGFPVSPEEGEDSVIEGRLLYRVHRVRERNEAIVNRKKASVLKECGVLACEACGFDFAATYGDLGEGFIECHHVVPLADSGETTTKLSELAVVCSNCHRMLHRREPWPSIEELRAVINT